MMKIPNNEKLWLTITDENNNIFYITSNKDRSLYYIYSEKDGKLGKAKTPVELEEQFIYTKKGKKK